MAAETVKTGNNQVDQLIGINVSFFAQKYFGKDTQLETQYLIKSQL